MIIHHYRESKGPYWVAAWIAEIHPAWIAEIHPELHDDIFDFCYRTFGPGLGDMRIGHPSEHSADTLHRWVNDIKWGEVRFRDEADLALFLLRWS